MEDRAERLAQYIIENRTTVRAAAQKFGISKSTVHTDDTIRNGPRCAQRGPFRFAREAPKPASGRYFCVPRSFAFCLLQLYLLFFLWDFL
mgnify:FL=1